MSRQAHRRPNLRGVSAWGFVQGHAVCPQAEWLLKVACVGVQAACMHTRSLSMAVHIPAYMPLLHVKALLHAMCLM